MVIAFIAPSKAGIAADGVGDEIDIDTQAPARPRHLRANLKLKPCTAVPKMEKAIKLKRISIFAAVDRENDDIAVEILGKVFSLSEFLKAITLQHNFFQYCNQFVGCFESAAFCDDYLL